MIFKGPSLKQMKQSEDPTLRCNRSIIKWIATFSLQTEKNKLFQEMLAAKKTSLWQLQFLFNYFNWIFYIKFTLTELLFFVEKQKINHLLFWKIKKVNSYQ